jgi:3-oxoacyl-[acyl-carrier-protein] synthase II
MPSRGENSARVVVTGMGAVSAVGWGVESLWTALRAGRSGIAEFSRFDHSQQRTHVAGEVPSGPPSTFSSRSGWSQLSLSERFGLFAALEAANQACLEAPLDACTAGVFFGTSTGGLPEAEQFIEESAGRRSRLSLMASHPLDSPGNAVARSLGVTGPVRTVSSACASAGLALEDAFRAVRDGEVDVAIAGGADSLCKITYAGFNSLRAVDEKPCAPFREGRAGMSLGEGGAALVLEPLDRALERGATPLAEILGAGTSCDAHHMTAPHPEGIGAAAALRRALAESRTTADEVKLINAHGTGTALNDASESVAFGAIFGNRSSRIALTATKSIVGHLLGCAGAIEAVATVLCLRAREAHPAAGGGRVDPALPVDLVLGAPRALSDEGVAVSINLSFGGANVAVVFAPWRSP